MDLQRKIFYTISVLSYFSCQEWKFRNERLRRLRAYILPQEMEEFDFDVSQIQPKVYFKQAFIGARKFILKDPIENVPRGIIKYKR